MNKCNRCRKEKDIELFSENNKLYKICIDCRKLNRIQSKNWREKNKEVVSLYNKTYNDKKADNSEVIYVYAKKK